MHTSTRNKNRLTANITVNMFSVAVYYQTFVQDASVSLGPCRKTACRYTHCITPTYLRSEIHQA